MSALPGRRFALRGIAVVVAFFCFVSVWADTDRAIRQLAKDAGQGSPLMRIGLEPAHTIEIDGDGPFRIIDPSTGRDAWRKKFTGAVRAVADGGPTEGVRAVYRIQVGAFGNEAAAEAERARLAQKLGVPAVVRRDPDRGTWRVRVGEHSERLSLNPLMERLAALGIDDAWIAAHTTGFEELRDAVADWTPSRAADVTGVAADVIEQLALDYATVRPAGIRTLIGAEHHENGAMFFRTLGCLPALTGAWAERGGGIAKSVGSYSEDLIDVVALFRPDLERAGGRREPRTLNMSLLGAILTSPHAGGTDGPGVHALIVWNCNPLATVPRAESIRRGMERDDLFTVVHEQFLTDTARYADIVLPATTQIESDDVVLPWGHLWVGWNGAAIDPVGESCSNTELFRRLAQSMGYTEPCLFDDDDTLLRDALPTIDLDELRRVGWTRAPYPDDGRPFGDGDFETPSGRVELASDRLERMGQPRVPTFVAPLEGPAGDAELVGRYPLQLLTPKHHTRFLNSGYADLPKHGPAEGGPFVELDAVDAAARGLTDGAMARVWNDRASVSVPVKVTGRLRSGVVAIPFGWWSRHHPDGKVANSLTNDTLTEWGGGVAYSDTLVQVEALGA